MISGSLPPTVIVEIGVHDEPAIRSSTIREDGCDGLRKRPTIRVSPGFDNSVLLALLDPGLDKLLGRGRAHPCMHATGPIVVVVQPKGVALSPVDRFSPPAPMRATRIRKGLQSRKPENPYPGGQLLQMRTLTRVKGGLKRLSRSRGLGLVGDPAAWLTVTQRRSLPKTVELARNRRGPPPVWQANPWLPGSVERQGQGLA